MKSVVITGVSTGIGLATADAALRSGFQVFGSVRTETDALRLREQFPERFVPLVFDVYDEPAIQAAATLVAQTLGERRLDGLINNAGVAISGPLLYLPAEKLRHQFEVNLFGVMAVTRAFAPLLGVDPGRTGKPGRIINISSVVGLAGQGGQSNYAAAKAGVIGFTKSLAKELGARNITVNAVAPGFIPTALTDALNEEQKAATIKMTPLGRFGTAEGVAYAVSFLASGLAAFVTGAVLTVDGGLVMQ